MLAFAIADKIAHLLVKLLPKQWQDRIYYNASTVQVYVVRSKTTRTKPRMTFVEGVFATILFDLALFGTDNLLINWVIKTFTNFQNSWDKPFSSKQVARAEISDFCERLHIQQIPWIWHRPIEEYSCLNDFFSRKYQPAHAPPLGQADLVAPACCTFSYYQNDDGLQRLLIKGCDYALEHVGLMPKEDLVSYAKHPVFVGYLSPTDYHRLHSPISGTCIHCQMQDGDALSASVKFFGGRFNLLNKNKRLVIVLESARKQRIALVIVGGVGVNTIVYDQTELLGNFVEKGADIATFRAGGSAFAMYSSCPLTLEKEIVAATEVDPQRPLEVLVGESLASFAP